MRTRLFFASLLFTGLLNAQEIDLELYAGGFDSPVDIAHDYGNRMFVAEQGGKIIEVANIEGEVIETTFLNISSLVDSGVNEGGLLGLAFHPNYEVNGFFYINYTNPAGNTVIARYTRSTIDENVADPDSAMILMTIEQPYANHNGGCLRFGPDGNLYIGTGDGGSGGDPQNRAQNINSLLGKILRISVDGAAPYSIPDGNPYIDIDGADEIWAIGMRNPWKFSFNKDNGDLWIADVGQEEREEINKVPSTLAGINYGWRCYEGLSPFNMSQCDGITGFTAPVAEYSSGSTTNNCSITGGYLYTGSTYPNMAGKYLFADFCSNKIGILDSADNITWTSAFAGTNFSTFGEDNEGELFIAGISNGNVYRIIDNSVAGTQTFAGGTYTVYPNPADDEVFVEFKNIMAPASVSILDIQGKLLVKQDIAEGASRIDTSSLGSGIYMVKMESSGAVKHHKLVIR
jgi:glucose/arabinose dehydrogenase